MNRTLTRFALCMLFLVALLVSGLLPSHAQDEPVLDTFTVTVPTANVRAGASTTYAIVQVVQNSDRFDVLDQAQVGSHVWYKLALPGGASGWMRADLGVYHEAPRIVATPSVDEPSEAASQPDELTEKERAERNEVLSLYPGGDESRFLDYIQANGWRAEWDKERKAFQVETGTETYYFFPKLGIKGDKYSEERMREDLEDGFTEFGGSITSSNFEPGSSGLKISVYYSANYNRNGVKQGVTFRDDLANSQENIDVLASAIIDEFPELQGKEMSIHLVEDYLKIFGNDVRTIKEMLDRAGGYQVYLMGNNTKSGTNPIGENTVFIKVSVNPDKEKYEYPDNLGHNVFTASLAPFATNGSHNAADLNQMIEIFRRIGERYYYATGFPSYTLVGTER